MWCWLYLWHGRQLHTHTHTHTQNLHQRTIIQQVHWTSKPSPFCFPHHLYMSVYYLYCICILLVYVCILHMFVYCLHMSVYFCICLYYVCILLSWRLYTVCICLYMCVIACHAIGTVSITWPPATSTVQYSPQPSSAAHMSVASVASIFYNIHDITLYW